MNILVFSWRDPKHPLAGGAEQVMHEHMKGWIEKGHKVSLLSSRFSKSKQRETIDGVEVVRMGHQYLGVQVAGFFYYLKNKDNFDIVVDQFHGIPFFTPLYVGKPKMAVLQEVAREVWLKNPLSIPFKWIVGWIGYFGEFFVFQLYRNTIFMVGSESARKDLQKMWINQKNITVIPHGVLLPRKRDNYLLPKNKIKTIVFLGMMTEDKGIMDALEIFRLLNMKDNYNFWIIGRAETITYENKIKKFVKDNNMEKKIKFWGFVSQEKKFELLAKSHLLVNPSIREGWGLVNIEANAMGTPVVAYKYPGLIDSVKSGYSGVFSKKNTAASLAEEIAMLMRDKSGYLKLTRSSKMWSKKFDWEASRKMGLKLINKLVK